MSNKDWFDDSLFGPKETATTADACLVRKASWETDCPTATVEMSYNGGTGIGDAAFFVCGAVWENK